MVERGTRGSFPYPFRRDAALPMQKFPQSVTAEDGYRRLQKALVGTGFELIKGKAAEKAVAQVRKGAGYFTQRTKDGWIWIKPPNEHLTTTHIQ